MSSLRGTWVGETHWAVEGAEGTAEYDRTKHGELSGSLVTRPPAAVLRNEITEIGKIAAG